MTVFQAGAIAGPLVAGALIPVLGFSWLYLIDTFTLFATLCAVVRLPRLPVEDAADRARPGCARWSRGFAYLRGHPVLLMSFVVDLIAMVFGMPRALFPEIAHESFGGPAGGGLAFALLFAAIPTGAVIGGVFSGWVSRVDRQGRAVIVCILRLGRRDDRLRRRGRAGRRAGATSMLAVAVLMLVLGGAADMASAAFRTSMLQSAATDSVRGRLQGVFIVVVAGGPRIADVAHGACAAMVGTAAAAAGGGVLVVVGDGGRGARGAAFVRYRAHPGGSPSDQQSGGQPAPLPHALIAPASLGSARTLAASRFGPRVAVGSGRMVRGSPSHPAGSNASAVPLGIGLVGEAPLPGSNVDGRKHLSIPR